MKTTARLICAAFGIFVIITTLTNAGSYQGLDSPIWGLLLGIGLLIFPFTALGMLLTYLLMVGIPIGLAILGAYIGVQISGKQSLGVVIGLVAGGAAGFKFVVSDAFDTLLNPVRKLADADDKDS